MFPINIAIDLGISHVHTHPNIIVSGLHFHLLALSKLYPHKTVAALHVHQPPNFQT